MKWLPHASAILLLLYPEEEGLLTPQVVKRAKNMSEGISGLTQATLNTTLKKLETEGHIKKERTEEKSKKFRNSPNRVQLTAKGRVVAKKLVNFFNQAISNQKPPLPGSPAGEPEIAIRTKRR